MESLPDELILSILRLLGPHDAAVCQAVSRRYRRIARDANLWRDFCFDNSRAETTRRRFEMHPTLRLAEPEIRSSVQALIGTDVDPDMPRERALASWDPAFPFERVDFCLEYAHRHAPVSVQWLCGDDGKESTGSSSFVEAAGVGIIPSSLSEGDKVLSSFEDGSACIYNVDTSRRLSRRRRLLHQTPPGHLISGTTVMPSEAATIASDATDKISVDARLAKAYIATLDHLSEIDLETMQVTQQYRCPSFISALSAKDDNLPLTVGTNATLQLYDPRERLHAPAPDPAARLELIGGKPRGIFATYSQQAASLEEPGPLSIQHGQGGDGAHSIWIAGRFTSLLHYDRRTWPRIERTVYSGARLSGLAQIPHPYVGGGIFGPRRLSPAALVAAKNAPGSTLYACGSYKGKGSLELYALDPSGYTQPDTAVAAPGSVRCFRNRYTASTCRLLSVAAHGARIVFSDARGQVKWVERDGSSLVRSFNVNDFLAKDEAAGEASDIVRKILPLEHAGSGRGAGSLCVWTGEGRVGLVGLGQSVDADEGDAASRTDSVLSGPEAAQSLKEHEYSKRIRSALERQADETRWLRGFGLG